MVGNTFISKLHNINEYGNTMNHYGHFNKEMTCMFRSVLYLKVNFKQGAYSQHSYRSVFKSFCEYDLWTFE